MNAVEPENQIRQDSPTGAPTPHAARVKKHTRTHFEKWALSYDRSRLNELVFYPSVRACQEEIARWQESRGPRPFDMLDVGCGTGTLLALTAREPHARKLVGLDYAEEMVRRAAEKFAQKTGAASSLTEDDLERVMLRAVRGDAEHLPFADETFDVITCCNSFHHYPHQAAAIRGFHRVLRPGGLLVLIDGFRDNVIGWVVFDVAVALVEKHVHHASWSEFKALINNAGFAELNQRKLNVLAPLLVNVAKK